MNQLISRRGYKDYLEIGVQRGVTFLDISAQSRDAIDPSFLFDVSQHASAHTRFFEMTSDAFFASGLPGNYDLIFIDGWHSFEQALRDFCNALLFLRNGGAIVIDDVYPDDVFSALPTQDEAIQARVENGLNTGPYARSWAGDVFKVVFFIHDFFPVLDYVTLHNPENPFHKPQTVVWKSPRAPVTPVFDGVEAIDRTTWFDLARHEDVFHFATIEEALRLFDASFSSRPRLAASDQAK